MHTANVQLVCSYIIRAYFSPTVVESTATLEYAYAYYEYTLATLVLASSALVVL